MRPLHNSLLLQQPCSQGSDGDAEGSSVLHPDGMLSVCTFAAGEVMRTKRSLLRAVDEQQLLAQKFGM